MHDEISYSELFARIDDIRAYLKQSDASIKYCDTLQQVQRLLLILELMNIRSSNEFI